MAKGKNPMTKYHQQAQARANKHKVWRAEIKQEKNGSFTLTPEKTHITKTTKLGALDAKR